MRVRIATGDELVDVMRLVDGALLSADAPDVETAIEERAVLVALLDGRIVGALVLDVPTRRATAPRPEERAPDTRHVEAVAVHRRHRSKGVGTALVEAAAERSDYLTATFREDVRPFYESLGFDVEDAGGDHDRCHGMR
jgi:GNAT superfamily N-acetyltransferase